MRKRLLLLLFAALLLFVSVRSCVRAEKGEVGTTVSEYESQLYAEALSITVFGSVVILVIGGVVYFGWKMRSKPPIAPQPLPRTQSEESSNQEEGPPEPPPPPKRPDAAELVGKGACLVVIGLGLAFLIWICSVYVLFYKVQKGL